MYGWKWQEYYSADYRYIPLVESPGVAFIIIEKEGLSPSQRLVNEVFATWPYMIVTTLLAALAGIVIWFLVIINLYKHVVAIISCTVYSEISRVLMHVWRATFKQGSLGNALRCLVFMSFLDLKSRHLGQVPHCCRLSRALSSCEFSLRQDTKSNPDHFPHTFLRGSGNGFWWAFISMTTLG